MNNSISKSPCNNCPYRKDAPLRLWSYMEFEDLLEKDKDYLGSVYGCHKNNGKLCTGFVMNQDKRRVPSITLRIALSNKGITVADLDELKCKSELYETIEEMAHVNYPEIFDVALREHQAT